jgi:hypothetical protein
MAKKKPTYKIKEEPSVIVFHTFRKLENYEISNLRDKEFSCFNGIVNIRKYKITIELVEEPTEVLGERLQQLWDECNNHHHWTPLREASEKIGYELKGSAGSKRKSEY